jgi:hypothetical protein
MLKRITLKADESDIEGAHKRAAQERTTLNRVFRDWLHRYARPERSVQAFRNLISETGYASAGGNFTRDERNARSDLPG